MLTKQELLNALCGKTVVKLIEGLGEVEIKSLSFADIQSIQALELDGMETALQMVIHGLVTPKLEEEDIETLKLSQPKLIFSLASAITELSGMNEGFLPNSGEAS